MPYIYKKRLLRALQEGLTNSIKHGKNTGFELLLKNDNKTLEFILKDNGNGTDDIHLGFGLKV